MSLLACCCYAIWTCLLKGMQSEKPALIWKFLSLHISFFFDTFWLTLYEFSGLFSGSQPRRMWVQIHCFGDLFYTHHRGRGGEAAPVIHTHTQTHTHTHKHRKCFSLFRCVFLIGLHNDCSLPHVARWRCSIGLRNWIWSSFGLADGPTMV
jgi:hypothetical protein